MGFNRQLIHVSMFPTLAAEEEFGMPSGTMTGPGARGRSPELGARWEAGGDAAGDRRTGPA